MIDYKVYVNNGIEALGVNQKTITANEDLRTVDEQDLAREIHHENTLIPEQVAQAVLQNFCKAAAKLMAMGFAIQLRNGNDVAMRIHPDIHVEGGNIDLQRAIELMPDKVAGEDDMVTYAGDLVSRAGVTLKVRAESQPKFTELLKSLNPGVNRTGVVERAKVLRKDGTGGTTPNPGTGGGTTPDPGTGGGGTNQGGGNQGGGTGGGGSQGGGGNDPTPGGDE